MDRIIDMLIAVLVPTIVFIIQDTIKEKKRRKQFIEQIDQKQNEELQVLREGIKAPCMTASFKNASIISE